MGNFEQPGAVAAFWQRQGLRPGQPYLAFCVANDSSLDLRRQMVALASASRAPFSAAAMVQEHLYLLLQCPEAEALRGYALDTEAALGECRLPAGVSALCTDIGQLIRVLGEAAAAQEACFFTGGGVVPYSAIHGLPPIDREAAHARKQEVLRLLARRQVEEARGALRAWFALFGMVGADDVRWAVDTVNRMVISMEDWYYQFVTPPADGSRHSRPIETALSYIHAHYAQPISMAEVAAQLYRSPEHFSRQFKEEVGENFSSYLTRYRLERAQELLQTTDLPVASVAVQTGYTTPGYFSRLYKKYKGVSPEAERRGSKS